ncbi:hypothetical protein B0O99DRAFT_690428 [Bisporella sp. PMI_857]|nr:hypothetical protein B0O99DRAFT_690428 [Bisporella sp. PMI_857]
MASRQSPASSQRPATSSQHAPTPAGSMPPMASSSEVPGSKSVEVSGPVLSPINDGPGHPTVAEPIPNEEPGSPVAEAASSIADPSRQPKPENQPDTCWICAQGDSDEDPEKSGGWRRPCQCSLVAHNDCLMEWISRKPDRKDIKCPACNMALLIDQPTNVVDFVVQFFEDICDTAIIGVAAGAVSGIVYSGCLVYGLNTIYTVFGAEEATNILGFNDDRFLIESAHSNTLNIHQIYGRGLYHTIQLFSPFMPSSVLSIARGRKATVFFGLPLIAPLLFFGANKNLSPRIGSFALPYALYHLLTPPQNRLQQPLSPAIAFAVLPSVRLAYRNIYAFAFSGLEKRWALTNSLSQADGEANPNPDNEVFGVQIVVEGDGDEEVVNAEIEVAVEEAANGEQAQDAAEVAEAVAEEVAQEIRNEIGAQVNVEPPQAAAPNRRAGQLELFLPFSQMLVTLLLPAFSALVGDILKYSLPSRLVSKGIAGASKRGILQERWGRTIIGGCIFVVLRDASVLFAKWNRYERFHRTRILNYRGPGGRDSSEASTSSTAAT